jgi:hypothetical protein
MLSFVVVGPILSCMATCCPRGTPAGAPRSEVRAALKLLRSCPAWVRGRAEGGASALAIERHLVALDGFSTPVLRCAVTQYLSRSPENRRKLDGAGGSVAAWGRVFILVRYVFEVPESRRGFAPVPNGFRNRTTPIWPLSWDRGGRLVLTGDYYGYNGPAYRAVTEFDYFARHFGRRKDAHRPPPEGPSELRRSSILSSHRVAAMRCLRRCGGVAEPTRLGGLDPEALSRALPLSEENTP